MADEAAAKEAIRKLERVLANRKATQDDIDGALKAVEETGHELAISIARHMAGERLFPPGSTK